MSVPAPATPGVAARAVDLRKIYGHGDAAVQALRGVSVDFAAAEFTAIMGPSGSGKSTLLHCMAGLDTPTSGNVLIGDVDLTTLSEKALTTLRRDKVGFVFQAFNLIPTLTASENITLPLDIAGRDVDRAWFDQVVDTIGIRDRLGPSAVRALRRAAAARGRRPRVGEPARDRLRRRTHGEPGLPVGCRVARVPARSREGIRPDDRDGHPRRRRRRATPTGSCSSPTGSSSMRCVSRRQHPSWTD